jgi:hypothetical protein
MRKIELSLLLFFAVITLSFGQDNKVDGNGQRKGEWYVMYSGEITYHDPYSLLEDFNKMLVSDKETEKLENATYFEDVKYKKGIKSGEFKIYSTSKNNEGNYPLLAMGEYDGGEITGNLNYADNYNKTLCTIKYSQGSIIDQNAVISSRNMKHPGNELVTYDFYEQAIFKNGLIIEFYALNSGKHIKLLPQKYVKNDKGWNVFKYTEKPYCFNNYSFLTKQEIKDNNYKSLVELNTNNVGLEVYHINNKSEKEGKYRLFQSGKALFDTTHLSAIVNFKNDLRNGEADFWDKSRNGHSENPFIKVNYKNDKLHGKAILYYSWLGKPAATMNFENGLLSGSLISFWDADKGYPFVGKNIAAKCTFNGGFLMPYQVGDFNQDILGSIKELQDDGNDVENPSGYFRFSEQNYIVDSIYNKNLNTYVKYSRVDGKYSWYTSENIKYADYLIGQDGQAKDFAIMDRNGNDILTMSGLKENISKNLEEERIREEEIRNTIVKCEFCSKSVKIGDSKITWGGCDCFQDNNDKIGIYGTVSTYFCSQKCKIDYEKECCRRNGYKFEKN